MLLCLTALVGYHASLSTFTREVAGPFLLSADSFDQACRVQVSHEGALPVPLAAEDSALAAADDDAGGSGPGSAANTEQVKAKL